MKNSFSLSIFLVNYRFTKKIEGAMKKYLVYLALSGIIACTEAFADNTNGVIEVYNDCAAPCCSAGLEFSGLYLEANLGYSWFKFNLHRPPSEGLLPLIDGEVKVNNWSFVPAIGYDLYPSARIPVRLEFSYLYTDNRYGLNPLFNEDLAPGLFAQDSFRIYNSMATLYVDWHNCSRITPFVGISYGLVSKKTHHFTNSTDVPNNVTTTANDHDSAWGGTAGLRFQFTCHVFGNLQYRYSDMKNLRFKNSTPQLVSLPSQTDYLSDFLHENTVLVGVGYQF
jgi:opacity protein-like surface antigen